MIEIFVYGHRECAAALHKEFEEEFAGQEVLFKVSFSLNGPILHARDCSAAQPPETKSAGAQLFKGML